MPHSKLTENLKLLMRLHGNMNAYDLAKRTNLSQSTIHRILSNETKQPQPKVLEKIAQFFEIRVDQLFGTAPLPEALLLREKPLHSVPVIDWENIPMQPGVNLEVETGSRCVVVDGVLSSRAFALVVEDNDFLLEPIFPNQSILIFDPEKVLSDRSYALIHNRARKVFFSKVFFEGGLRYYKSSEWGEALRLTKFVPSDKIIAVLCETRRSF